MILIAGMTRSQVSFRNLNAVYDLSQPANSLQVTQNRARRCDYFVLRKDSMTSHDCALPLSAAAFVADSDAEASGIWISG